MSILTGAWACVRYAVAFVLVLITATALNVGIVLGWNYLNPGSFNRVVATAVDAADPAVDGALWQTAEQDEL